MAQESRDTRLWGKPSIIEASSSSWLRNRERLGYETSHPFHKHHRSRLVEGTKLSSTPPVLWVITVTHIRSSVIIPYNPIFRTQTSRFIRFTCDTKSTLNAQPYITTIPYQYFICFPKRYGSRLNKSKRKLLALPQNKAQEQKPSENSNRTWWKRRVAEILGAMRLYPYGNCRTGVVVMALDEWMSESQLLESS